MVSEESFNLHQTEVNSSTEKGITISHPSEIHLTWQNLTVLSTSPVPIQSCCARGNESDLIPNILLNEVSGVARPGDFVAILGASGSGKTTLLNALASRLPRKLEVSGDVKFNGLTIPEDKIKDLSGYVGQDDTFVASMTVCEVIFFYASLKLDPLIPRKEKELMALEALQKVGLSKIKNSFVGDVDRPGISGGEKKRLAVATQLIFGASLLFLDEVTSGLDSFMAESVIKIMKDLAESGCTILCTIHQPSSVLYDFFDKVCLLSEGKIAFFGSHTDALTHFEEAGYSCPPYHCPADHFIYTLAIKSDDEVKCRERCADIVQSYERSKFYKKVITDIESISKYPNNINNKDVTTTHKATTWGQFSENLCRSVREMKRNPKYARGRFISDILAIVFLGFFYFNTSNNIDTVKVDKGGVIFILVLVYAVRSIGCSALKIPLEFPVIRREYKNGLYSTLSYFLSVVFCEYLFVIPSLLVELAIFYFVVGLRADLQAFFTAYACLLLLTWTSNGIGWLIGVAAENPKVAGAIPAAFTAPFIYLGGFLKDDDGVGVHLFVFKYLSWIRYGYHTLMVNEFKDLTLDCGDEECPYNGTTVLLEMGINPSEVWWPNMVCNFVIGLGCNLLTCLLLPYKTAR
ncbi:protein white-like [Bolinopsis microptera]|uniref:protein white-like n=1 Tax=Bolinopsis microptera TaxID=2820187 RepID=UPI003079BF18